MAISTERVCSTFAPSDAISSISSVRDFLEPARLRHDARIGGVDAIDIGVDIAAIGFERSCTATALVSPPPRPMVVTRLSGETP